MTSLPWHGFTIDYTTIVNSITTGVGISTPIDPQNLNEIQTIWHTFKAIWDTGATNSTINRKVVEKLGLKPIDQTLIQTAGGMVKCNRYLVNLQLSIMLTFVGIMVTEVEIGEEDVLIGMDIISQGDFTITNFDGNTSMSFRSPSVERIHYEM